MNDVLAIDIETKNYSYDIGGWGNTHMFKVSTICTWDGDSGTIYIDKAVDDLKKSNVQIKPISQLKFDLVGFDLPVLRDALDIYCISKYLNKKAYIDTSADISKSAGERYSLENLSVHTLGASKLMNSADAPKMWKAEKYSEVAEYCLKDCELVYNLWKYGIDNSVVKGFNVTAEEMQEIEVNW